MREREYALLFNGITDVIAALQRLQQQAEELAIRQADVIEFESRPLTAGGAKNRRGVKTRRAGFV